MGKWKDFELELPDSVKESNYLEIRIKFDSAYKWGSGWGSEEAVRNYGTSAQAAQAWRDEVYSKLLDAGYYVKESTDSGSCATLHEFAKEPAMARDSLDIYMHPMEFSGFATQQQLEDIKSILENCNTVRNVYTHSANPVYSMSDYGYEQVLDNNAERIVRHICENYKAKDRKFSDDIAFDFAKEVRLPRANTYNSGLSSSDIDIKYVKRLADFCLKFDVYKKIDKEIKKEKDIIARE